MGESLLRLLWSSEPTALVERRRAQAIVDRTGMLALFFCAATLAWMPVDGLVFERELWLQLVLARVVAALALLGLAMACRHPGATQKDARHRLVLLFAVPAIFFIATTEIFHDYELHGVQRMIANAYSFLPFILAAGIAAFPLVAAESAGMALIALTAQAWAVQWHPDSSPFMIAEVIWLLTLIAMVAAFAAMSQLHLMTGLVQQAIRDPLTGCHRRESGRELLDIQFRIARRQGAPLAVLFADLDHFKRVNDRFGHEAGDRVLIEAAASLRVMLRESDLLLRWGGEEFVIVLPNTRASEAVALLDRLRAHGVCRRPDGKRMTLSIGIAEYLEDKIEDIDALIELADKRMYQAKQAGRNRYVRDEAAQPVPILA